VAQMQPVRLDPAGNRARPSDSRCAGTGSAARLRVTTGERVYAVRLNESTFIPVGFPRRLEKPARSRCR
jgi:hypothetical protein